MPVASVQMRLAQLRREALDMVKGQVSHRICPTCSSNLTPQQYGRLVETTTDELMASTQQYTNAEKALADNDCDAMQKAVDVKSRQIDESAASAKHVEAIQKMMHTEGERLAALEAELATLQPITPLAQMDLRDAPHPEPADVTAMRERIKKGRDIIAFTRAYIPVRASYDKLVADQAQAVTQKNLLDKLVEALAPKGPIATKSISGRINAFTEIVNTALGPFGYEAAIQLEPAFSVQVRQIGSADDAWLPMQLLSDSERLRLGFAIQATFATTSGFGIVATDEISRLDAAGAVEMIDATMAAIEIGVEQIILAGTMKGDPAAFEAPQIAGWEFVVLE